MYVTMCFINTVFYGIGGGMLQRELLSVIGCPLWDIDQH